jgi:hypothetical protein
VAPATGVVVTERSAVPGLASLAGAGAAGVGVGPVARAMDHLGQPSEAHIRYAAGLVNGLPPPIISAAHEPHGARAVVYALLLDRKTGPRQIQIAHLSAAADPGVYRETLRLAPAIEQLDVRTRLPLLDIALPALRGLTAAQYQRFKQNVNQLVQADDAIDPFEWSLHRIVLHELEADRSNVVPARVRHHTLAALQPECELLLSILARAGQRDTAAAAQAFEHGWRGLNLPQGRLRRADGNGLAALDTTLAALEEAAPRVKRQILQAAVACITADDTVTATEAELLRAFSTSLGCPMPPLLLT